MDEAQIAVFVEELGAFYVHGRREMPWREPDPHGNFDPYKIMVSEIMLQQTQVSRVVPKYEAFLHAFPNVQSLAQAPLAEVLQMWQGLGYNRRAKYLWQAAGIVQNELGGKLPRTAAELAKLPGIGVNTAGAIMAYACNEPVVFIETNVRTVFIHTFFADSVVVTDKEIAPLILTGLRSWITQGGSPREFYWALMDYGSYLKARAGNSSRRSASYTRQSTFKGSKRQVRGAILRALSEGPLTAGQLNIVTGDSRTEVICRELQAESMITWHGDLFHLGM